MRVLTMLSAGLLWLQPVATTISFDIGVVVSSLAPVLAIVITWWLKNKSDKQAEDRLLKTTIEAAGKVAAQVDEVKETTLSTTALVAVKVAEVKAAAELVAMEVRAVRDSAQGTSGVLASLQETADQTHVIVNSRYSEIKDELRRSNARVEMLLAEIRHTPPNQNPFEPTSGAGGEVSEVIATADIKAVK